jgi:hypothetical protein
LGSPYTAYLIISVFPIQSKKLRQKWAETSHALSVQAHEMRRAVKQLSTNDLNGNAFIALKSKVYTYFFVSLN